MRKAGSGGNSGDDEQNLAKFLFQRRFPEGLDKGYRRITECYRIQGLRTDTLVPDSHVTVEEPKLRNSES